MERPTNKHETNDLEELIKGLYEDVGKYLNPPYIWKVPEYKTPVEHTDKNYYKYMVRTNNIFTHNAES